MVASAAVSRSMSGLVSVQPKIGVLALQGDFREHSAMLAGMGIEAPEVRLPSHLEGLDGLIIPGGESTTITKLMDRWGFRDGLPRAAASGMAVWGTCAGMIVLAKHLVDPYPEPLGLLDVTVSRNWFGRQVDSFEADFAISGVEGGPFRAIFIRAPVIERTGPTVEVLASLPDGHPVAVRQGRILATAFHPELTEDDRVHRMFLGMSVEGPLQSEGRPAGASVGSVPDFHREIGASRS